MLLRDQSSGTTIADINGNGPAAGDTLIFVGYGTAAQGATLTQVDAVHWSINSADGLTHDSITLVGATVHQSDFLFVYPRARERHRRVFHTVGGHKRSTYLRMIE